MREATSQRPVYLVRVATGVDRAADIENFSRVSALLRSDEIPFKVLEVRSDPIGPYEVIVISEEYVDQAFDLARGCGVNTLIYLDFARVAWEVTNSFHTDATLLGELKAYPIGVPGGSTEYVDHCRNTSYAIVKG